MTVPSALRAPFSLSSKLSWPLLSTSVVAALAMGCGIANLSLVLSSGVDLSASVQAHEPKRGALALARARGQVHAGGVTPVVVLASA